MLDALPDDPKQYTDAQWRSLLSPTEYRILRHAGTEPPGSGRYLEDPEGPGMYACAGCANPLYPSTSKFHSGCGWPSFFEEIEDGALTIHRDASHGMVRTEMRCARCDGHLGHIFHDAPRTPTGTRHCVNGFAVIFVPEGVEPAEALREHRQAQGTG
ncbi:MAG: peptide-methionine (R)-S-oxide reductase MsrB [Planctomycetota bacterium]